MKGYAEALNITDGDVVSINLIYQLERLGLSCDSWNNTGPSYSCELPRYEDDDSAADPTSSGFYGPFMPYADSEEEEYAREVAHQEDEDEIDAPAPARPSWWRTLTTRSG